MVQITASVLLDNKTGIYTELHCWTEQLPFTMSDFQVYQFYKANMHLPGLYSSSNNLFESSGEQLQFFPSVFHPFFPLNSKPLHFHYSSPSSLRYLLPRFCS